MAGQKVNELLCFITHQYTRDPVDTLKETVLSFYDGDEVLNAKNMLFKDFKDILGKPVPRKDSAKRSQCVADCSDIFDALEKLDYSKQLPKYSAVEFTRLPGFKAPS